MIVRLKDGAASAFPVGRKKQHILGLQATLKDFQATMKAAKAKEAASLPKQPEPSRVQLPPAGSQATSEDAAEQTGLLQV